MESQDYEAMRATVETLRLRYPQAFPRKSVDVRPLMVGIDRAIFADPEFLSKGPDLRPHLGRALQWWISRAAYLVACIAGEARLDLAGAPAGHVTAEEAAFAAARLAKQQDRKRRKAPSPAAATVADASQETSSAKPQQSPEHLAGLKAAAQAAPASRRCAAKPRNQRQPASLSAPSVGNSPQNPNKARLSSTKSRNNGSMWRSMVASSIAMARTNSQKVSGSHRSRSGTKRKGALRRPIWFTAAEASAEKQPANDVAGARRGYEGEYNDFGHFHIPSILVCHPSRPSRQI
jgi:sRNA-binding protein